MILFRRIFALIMTISLLAIPACVRALPAESARTAVLSIPVSTLILPQDTPGSASITPPMAPPPTPDATANPVATWTAQVALTPGAAQSTGLPAAVLQTLAIMPLEAGSSWVYTDDAYSGNEKVTWRVVDTVTDNLTRPPLFAARIQREVTLLSGVPSVNFINPPRNSVYWYLVSGSQVFRQDTAQPASLKWDHLDQLFLEFVLPFPSQASCWVPDPALRENPTPTVGCRSAGPAISQNFPAGTLDRCHPIVTSDNTGSEKITFCDGVGTAERVFDHHGSVFGDHFVLNGYLVQAP